MLIAQPPKSDHISRLHKTIMMHSCWTRKNIKKKVSGQIGVTDALSIGGNRKNANKAAVWKQDKWINDISAGIQLE